jgi:hypothetical protein
MNIHVCSPVLITLIASHEGIKVHGNRKPDIPDLKTYMRVSV